MRLTTKGRYGLRFMIELAFNYGKGPVLVGSIAKEQGISANYIHVLATALRNSGMIRTIRGPNGGYELGRDPKDINVLQIVEILEGRNNWMQCVDDACACPRAQTCAARDVWTEVASAVDAVLSRRSLADLAHAQRGKLEASSMYYI